MTSGRENKSSESSDTDKTSGSLFHLDAAILKATRNEELPKNFFVENKEVSGNAAVAEWDAGANASTKRLRSRSHLNQIKSQKNEDVGSEMQQQNLTLGNEFIAEMNRQYDHNTCLDRFINDIECKQQNELNIRSNSIHSDIPSVIDPHLAEPLDRGHNENSPSYTDDRGNLCSSGDGSSNNRCGSCTSGSSSDNPPSVDETDNSSSNSISIKSSTPESGEPCSKPNSPGSGNKSPVKDILVGQVTDSNANRVKSTKEVGNKGDSKLSSNCKNVAFGESNLKIELREVSSDIESGVDVHSVDMNFSNSESNSNNYKGGKIGRKRRRGYIYDPKPLQNKVKRQCIAEVNKDRNYWDKRRRNNEAARKSRAMRMQKEQEVHERFKQLRKENEALHIAIALLIKRNETLDCILTEYNNSQKSKVKKVPIEKV